MTTSFGLDSNHDLYLNSFGNMAMVSGIEAVTQNCQTAMLSIQGEMIYGMTQGIPYRTIVWDNYSPKLFETAARNILISVQDVISVLSFKQTMEGNVLSYTAVIQTNYGTVTVTNTEGSQYVENNDITWRDGTAIEWRDGTSITWRG